MRNTLTSIQATPVSHKYCLTKTIYAVGIDPAISTKDRIVQSHGSNADVVHATAELEAYIARSDFKKSGWFLRFFSRVRRIMGIINTAANEYTKTQMAQDFTDELINDGYICCLKSMAVPSGLDYVTFARSYAATHNMPLAAALLFHPYGGVHMALRYFLVAEKYHGQHRPLTRIDLLSKKGQKQWFDAGKTINWPTVINDKGCQDELEMVENQDKLPEHGLNILCQLWRRNPSLRGYTGANRLSGDTPFKIVEDAVDIIFCSKSTPTAVKTDYEHIVEAANREGIDPFYAVYSQLFSRKDQLRPYWDRARTMLYEYSLRLWEIHNQELLICGSRSAADGVTYRPKKNSTRMPLKRALPGTIYLNNGRYYWVVKDKMKPVALVDPRNKKLLPGTIGNCRGRYFWVIPGVLKRQRLVAKGQKFSTTDRTTAVKIALQLWQRIQEKQPKLAAKIKVRRAWGTATQDKALAERIARRMWKHIQQNDPELTARILSDNRLQSQDHWIAQICACGKRRHLGSFKTRAEAKAAYTSEFGRIFGYSPGYNVQSMPKLDKVWPSWQEQKARLENMDVTPAMPVIGLTDKAESLIPIIDRMRKVDWLVRSCMLVLDDSAPCATSDVATESRGRIWYGEVKQHGKNAVIYGCTAVDKDNNRIRITLFSTAFNNAAVLAEEVYHLVYRIIGNTRPLLARRIQSWYDNNIRIGLDPTLSEDEAFARTMANADITNSEGELPASVFQHSKKLFSDSCRLPHSVLDNIISDPIQSAITDAVICTV